MKGGGRGKRERERGREGGREGGRESRREREGGRKGEGGKGESLQAIHTAHSPCNKLLQCWVFQREERREVADDDLGTCHVLVKEVSETDDANKKK